MFSKSYLLNTVYSLLLFSKTQFFLSFGSNILSNFRFLQRPPASASGTITK
ncbi:hypothetical protein LEP1GSC137_3671 [Leptospira borgpetersenii str. Noumea 25]|nr:hypothetical protein LEP1GSC137_3671 [Leptospira borgpetersenii str. Noumea 25]